MQTGNIDVKLRTDNSLSFSSAVLLNFASVEGIDFQTLLWDSFIAVFSFPDTVPYKKKIFKQICKPAVEFLRMFLPHCVKPVGNGGILQLQHNTTIIQPAKLKTKHFLLCYTLMRNSQLQ